MPGENWQAQWVDPMDTVIQQLQPAGGESPVIPEGGTPPAVPEWMVPETPVEQHVPAQPTSPQGSTPAPAGPTEPVQPTEPTASDDLLKEIDDLLNDIEKEIPKEEPKKPEAKADLVQPKALANIDSENLTVDEKQEIINYVDELETIIAENDFNYKTLKIERDQLEHLLEKERSKHSEVFDKFKELERENKKVKASSLPDDLQTLVDFYKLNKENNTLYNKRNLVGEAAKIIEQITEVKMDDYLMSWLKSWSYFNQEWWGSPLDLPPAKKSEPGKDDFNILTF